MKIASSLLLTVAVMLIMWPSDARSDLQPLVGVHTFAGAERGNGEGVDGPAGAIGGMEAFGLYPFTKTLGLQGSLLNQGGRGGYRLGLTLGPVFDYGSGKLGLFTDYIRQERGDNNFVYLRGQWAHYFNSFDLVFSYSHPVNSVQRTPTTVTDSRFVDGTSCGAPDVTQTRTRKINARTPAMNELKSYVRLYPTERAELSLGFLVNSFAGPDRNKTGTGFGGIFGASMQIFDWLVFRAVQGQMDTRERYRITSGLEFVWAPDKTDKSERRVGDEGKDTTFALASAAGSSSSTTAFALTGGG